MRGQRRYVSPTTAGLDEHQLHVSNILSSELRDRDDREVAFAAQHVEPSGMAQTAEAQAMQPDPAKR
jgi:hypothetical protein